MWCISSRTNSPAAVDALSPRRSFCFARCVVARSGMMSSERAGLHGACRASRPHGRGAPCNDAAYVNILYVTSEVARYAKTGGLADVSAALPAYLRRAGHDVRIVMPYYGQVDDRGATLEVVLRDVEVRLGNHHYEVAIIRASRPGDAPVHLVHCPA